MEQLTTTVLAGRRAYHFDVRTDKRGSRYLTISEHNSKNGRKARIFLYAEDFEKFSKALGETIAKADVYKS